MLRVLKRTVSMRRFFWAPRTHVKLDGQENIRNFTLNFFSLSQPKLPCERLFSSATNTHQKGITTILSNHTSNTRHMFYGIHEEYKFHLLRWLHVEII